MHQPSFETYKSRSELHLLLGKCFATKKFFSPALKQYRLAGQTTEVMEKLYELGEVAESMGDPQTTKQCWEEICTVDINFKDVKGKVAYPALRPGSYVSAADYGPSPTRLQNSAHR
jgi:hypothetical protein